MLLAQLLFLLFYPLGNLGLFQRNIHGPENCMLITFGSEVQRETNLAAPNGFGRLVLAGLGEERGEATVDVLVDFGVSSSFLRAGVGGVD